MFRAGLLFMAVAMLAGATVAQITITAEDFPGPGSTLTHHQVYDQEVNVGSAGPNQTWTIPNYGGWDVLWEVYVDPESTPHGGTFPEATLASTDDAGASFSYYRLVNDGLFFMGLGGNLDDQDTVIVLNPEAVIFPLPLTMGTSWTTVWYLTTDYEGTPLTLIDSSLWVVDGWGTLNTPLGSWPVLRMQQHHFSSLVVPDTPPLVLIENYAYHWRSAEGMQGASILQAATGDPDPEFTVGDVQITLTTTTSAGNPRGPVAEALAVGQNYPNPFNPATVLPVELQHAGAVTVSVFDETGRLVHTLNATLPAGAHEFSIDGSGWATGTYFAQVRQGAQTLVRKMQLVK